MPSQHRETLFVERRAVVASCYLSHRRAWNHTDCREVSRTRRESSACLLPFRQGHTYTCIRIRIKRFTRYTIALFWRTRAEPNPPQPATRMCLRIFLFSRLDRPTNKLSATFTLRARQTRSFHRRFSFRLRSRASPPRFYSFLDANRSGAARRDVRHRCASRLFNRRLRWSTLSRANRKKLPFLAKANTAIRISLWRKQRREPGKPWIGESETRAGFSSASPDFGISGFLLSGLVEGESRKSRNRAYRYFRAREKGTSMYVMARN